MMYFKLLFVSISIVFIHSHILNASTFVDPYYLTEKREEELNFRILDASLSKFTRDFNEQRVILSAELIPDRSSEGEIEEYAFLVGRSFFNRLTLGLNFSSITIDMPEEKPLSGQMIGLSVYAYGFLLKWLEGVVDSEHFEGNVRRTEIGYSETIYITDNLPIYGSVVRTSFNATLNTTPAGQYRLLEKARETYPWVSYVNEGRYDLNNSSFIAAIIGATYLFNESLSLSIEGYGVGVSGFGMALTYLGFS